MHSEELLTVHVPELEMEVSPEDDSVEDDAVEDYDEGFDFSALQAERTPRNSISGRLRHIFANQIPDGDELDEIEGRRGSVCVRVHTYNRLMAAHTRRQLEYPAVSTVPSYSKTMHHFTLDMLNRHREVSRTKSETSSPHISARQAVLPSMVQAGAGGVTIDDAPVPPCPTPERSGRDVPRTMMSRGLKPRSTTQPPPRDFAMGSRDRGVVM